MQEIQIIENVLSCVTSSLKIPKEKLILFHKDSQNIQKIKKFLNEIHSQHLFFGQNKDLSIFVSDIFPICSTKICVFGKSKIKVLHINDLVYCDMNGNPFNHLELILKRIVKPISQNLPKPIALSLNNEIVKLENKISVIEGLMKGRIRLPLISNSISLTNESLIIDWCRLINDCLSEEPNEEMDYYEYWRQRCDKLNDLMDQLSNDKVKKVIWDLQDSNSIYYRVFQDLYKLIVNSVNEAEDILINLKPLMTYFEKIDNRNFLSMIRPIFHTLGLIWSNCKSFQAKSKFIVLIKKTSNHLATKIEDYLNKYNKFKYDIDKSLVIINKSLMMADLSIKIHEEYKELFSWKYSNESVMLNLTSIRLKLSNVERVLRTAKDYENFSRIEIGGIKGKECSNLVNKMKTQFNNAFEEFLKNESVLNFNNHLFEIEKGLFKLFEDIICESYSLNDFYKTIKIFDKLLDRPNYSMAIRSIAKKKLKILMYLEFKNLRKILNSIPSLPRTTFKFYSALLLHHQLKNRFEDELSIIEKFTLSFLTQEDMDVFKEIEPLINELYNRTKESFSGHLKLQLSRNILLYSTNELKYHLDKNDGINEILKEIFLISKIDINAIPVEYQHLIGLNLEFGNLTEQLKFLCDQCNSILNNMNLQSSFKTIQMLQSVEANLVWSNLNLMGYLNETLHKLKLQENEENELLKRKQFSSYKRTLCQLRPNSSRKIDF